MDINLSSLHFFDFEVLESTFKGALPISQEDATFYTIANLFYADVTNSSVIKEWIEHFKKRKHSYVLARGKLRKGYNHRCAAKVIYGLFKTPVSVESFRTNVKAPFNPLIHDLPRFSFKTLID